MMDQMVSREQDFEIDLEAGVSDVTKESTSERSNLGVPEKIGDDVVSPLMGNENPTETSSQSSDLSGQKCDVGRKFKKSRKASKPPRPPKGPSLLSATENKVMTEIADLAMRKRARIERMKNCLRRIKAAKSSSSSSSSSSSCISFLSMIVTVLFLVFLLFQGFFAGNTSLSSDKSPAPIVSPNNRLVSFQFNNEFAPVEQTDPSPTTSFRYTRKRISGAEEEDSRDVTR
uniref:Transmembrane protein n=2 Tax=Noccaea caerulescens TaxID=107243 RepID=A0A1J3HKW5_NOCCA